eukprot:scaffold5463_cov155-Skeletonema_marinoi.AAC.18
MIPSSRSGNSLFAAASLFVVLNLLCQSIFFEATAFQPNALYRINHFKNDAPRFRFPTALYAAKKNKQSNDDDDSDNEAIISIPSTTAARKKLLAKRKQVEADSASSKSSSKISIKNDYQQSKTKRFDGYYAYTAPSSKDDDDDNDNSYLIDLKKKIDQKIMRNNWNRTGQRRPRVNGNTLLQQQQSSQQSSSIITPGQLLPEVHVQHETDSMQSLLGYNHFEGEWSDRNSTTYHVAIVFGKGLIHDQISIEYATRIRTLVKMLKEEEGFRPKLICFTGGNKNTEESGSNSNEKNSVSDASAGYVYFRHLCASQDIHLDHSQTNVWVDKQNGNERETMERVASELWRKYIKTWLQERPLTERLNQNYGVGWHILERRVDIHFTLVSTEYHLCNLNDVHHRSPGKSFLQPLVSLRGLVGSDRWVNKDELEAMDPSYSSSVHVRSSSNSGSSSSSVLPTSSSDSSGRARFAGIENSVDTSWSFQYATFPFLHGKEDSIVFLGQCYLLGEELTPLLVNMKGVVEQTEFFQRDNYLLLTSIRRSLVSLVEALYTDKGQSIRAGVIKYFESQGRNRFTKEDVKIIVLLESALLNLGRCIDLVKPAGLLAGSVPAPTWARALDALEKSMNNIQVVCDPDQPLDPKDWGKL